jgi:arabinose-5-phosphate isomerase
MKQDSLSNSNVQESRTLERMRQVVATESAALAALADRIDAAAVEAVQRLYECQGRVVVVGMGKAGLIGRKISATLCSMGTPSLFLHPAEAFHGDLGMLLASDLLLALSTSGETVEVLEVVSHARRIGVGVICLTGTLQSSLAGQSDLALNVGVEAEGDPLGVAPMASTTAMLAMGDALAAAVAELRGFTHEQFAVFHPGGSLGRKLLLSVRDAMHVGDAIPLVSWETSVKACICEISAKRLGATFVVDEQGSLVGIFTDGDLRRLFEREANPLEVPVQRAMTRSPRAIPPQQLAVQALRLMEAHSITVLPVVDAAQKPIGALHLHDLVKMGLS